MTLVRHPELKSFLTGLTPEGIPPAWLVHGEESLCQMALDDLLARMVPESERAVGVEMVPQDDVADAIARIRTYSLLSDYKVVVLKDTRAFYAGVSPQQLLEKALAAWESKDMKQARKWMAGTLGLLKLTFDDVRDPESRQKHLKVDAEILGDGRWPDLLIADCIENGLKSVPVRDTAEEIRKAIESGFPKGHILILTADLVDRKRDLYQVLMDRGVIVDCSVPKTDRKQDRMAREDILRTHAAGVLSPLGKRLEPHAFDMMCDMTGFDLRMFSRNLEKLASYVGARPVITQADVAALLKKTRKDPIYELTHALAERNAKAALTLAGGLLDDGMYPLQILAALANQIRRLLLMKAFLLSASGRSWRRGISYPEFQKSIQPLIQAYDQGGEARLQGWSERLAVPEPETEGWSKKRARKGQQAKVPEDLLLLLKGKSPYPLYLGLPLADGFELGELVSALARLSDVDATLKSSPVDPRTLLEAAILDICRKSKPASPPSRNRSTERMGVCP